MAKPLIQRVLRGGCPRWPRVQVMAGGLKELKTRIGSVTNTKKITEAMKLVAAAKVRRAQEAVVNGRPFSENLVKVRATRRRGRAPVGRPGSADPAMQHAGASWRGAIGGAREAPASGAGSPLQQQCTRTVAHMHSLPTTRSHHPRQVLYGVNQRLRVEDVDSPLVAVRPVKTVLLVVITGDRGLCGGYNNYIIKARRQRYQYCCRGGLGAGSSS